MMLLLPALPQLLFSLLFSIPLPHSPKCFVSAFHLPRVGSMGMQWAQKLISDWSLRVLIWTLWCCHAWSLNKAHAFGWASVGSFESSSVETNLLLRPRCDLCKQPLKSSEDFMPTCKVFWKNPQCSNLQQILSRTSVSDLQLHTCVKIVEFVMTLQGDNSGQIWRMWASLQMANWPLLLTPLWSLFTRRSSV